MNRRAEILIEKLVYGGSGLGHLETGHTVFVPGVLPGERVVITIRRKRKGFYEADLSEILVPSKDRISPPCLGERQCTGATWPYIDYPAQLMIKQDILLDSLFRIGGMAPKRMLPILPSPCIDHYRLRAQFNVRTKDGKQRIGFFRQGSYDLIEVEDAFLLHPIINQTLNAIRVLSPQLPVLKEVHINASPGGEVHILLHCEQASYPFLKSFFSDLTKTVPQVVGITGFAHKKRAFAIGKNQLALQVDGLTLHATEGNFFQVNWEQNKNMVRTVLEFAALTGEETVLDLYCGVGNFSLPLAKKAKNVIGIESGYSSIEDAKANAALNGLTNTEFISSDMQNGLKMLLQRKMRANKIVLDPPRAGATLKTLERMLAFVPRKIIYVSCNPATVARDLKHFERFGFVLERLQPIDMFPYTYHIECIAEMVREQ
jgi:23S rRNA (uracil1939-C5)-methyltransferase